MRPGYSPDEEFTVMAVRGIAGHGLPLLPSGLLYDRGILYSYLSWIAHAVTGSELPAYRGLSLVAALIALWLVFTWLSRLRDRMTAVVGAALVATSIPFWATATSGRFYAPFLALYLGTLLMMGRSLAAVFVLAMLSRLTHELAFTLAAAPAIAWLVDRDRRSAWWRTTAAITAGLVAAQVLLFGLHWLTPTSGETMVRRFFLWQVLNLFERPPAGQFAIAIAVMAIGWLAAPRRGWVISVTALSLASMMLAFLLARASNSAPLSWTLARGVLIEGSRYPFDMFWHIAGTTPFTLALACAMLIARLMGAGGEWRAAERGLHALWLGWVLWFGVIDSGITTNYLLLPVSFMLMAIANDLVAILTADRTRGRRGLSAPGRLASAAVIVLALIVTTDQWRTRSLDEARPTIVAAGIDEIRASLQAGDRVACTDELGCLMLVGRIDRWLALDDYVRERFIVRRSQQPTGVYTGVPAVFRPGDLFAPNADGSFPDRVVVVDVFKEFAVGDSRTWLPRALSQDGVVAHVLLETSQLRIVELSPPERNARAGSVTGSLTAD